MKAQNQSWVPRPMRIGTAMASRISHQMAKSGCAREWGGWGRLSDDGPGQHNPDRSEGPGVERIVRSNGGAQAHNCPDTERGCTGLKAMSAKEGCKPEGRGQLGAYAG